MTHESPDGTSGGSASVEQPGDVSLDAVAAAVGEGVFRLDADGRFEAVNDVVLDLAGYDRSDLLGEELSRLLAEADAEAVEAAMGRAGDDDGIADVQVSVVTADGERVPCGLRLAPLGPAGRGDGTAGVLRDVTDRVREVEALERERSALATELDHALDRVTDAFLSIDDDGRFTYVNERAGELLDRDPESLVGEPVLEEFPQVEETPFVENALHTLETGEPVTFEEFYSPLASWFQVRLYPSASGVSVYLRDVTDEKRRESVLEQYETVVEAVDDGLYAVDEDYRFTLVNDAYCELTGYDREELLGEHISKVLDEATTEESMALREELLAGDGEAGSVEVEIVRADGERVTVESSYAIVSDDGFLGTVGVVRDVSEQRAFEEMLAALNEAARELQVTETDDDVADVVLRTLTDVLGLPTATLFREDEDAGVLVPENQTSAAADTGQELPELPAGDESLTGHVLSTGEFHAYGDVRETPYVEDPRTGVRSGLFAPLDEGRVLVVSSPEPGAFDERTERLVEILAGNASAALERQERERELRDSERRYRTLVDNFPDGAVALYDEGCRYVAVGGQMYDRIDLSPEDAVGMTVGERLSGEVADALESAIQRAFDGETWEVEAPYGSRAFRLQSLPIRDDDGDVILAMVVTQDVTERKEAQEALEASERRFRTMMEQSPLSTQIFDPDGNVRMVNPAWEELWGASKEEVADYNVLEDEQLEEKGIRPYLERGFEGEATQLPPVYYDPEEIGKEGRPRWIEAFVYPVFDDEGEIREVVLIHNDVTERKEHERELEQYERIVETVDDGVYVVDAESRLVLVNDAYCEIVGRDREELLGSASSTVIGEETVAELEEMTEALAAGETEDAVLEIAVERPDGETVTIETRFAPYPTEDGVGRMGVIRDVTERKERERALQQSERRYRTLAEQFPNGIVAIYDDDLRFELVEGQLMDEWEDVSPGDLVGRPATEVISAENRDDLEPILRAAFDGETNGVEVASDGRSFEVWSTPIRDADGEIFAGLAFAMDVTERKERERALEESERRYRTLIEHFPNGAVALVDQSMRYRTVGGSPLNTAGVTRDELEGAPLEEALPPELADELVPRYEAALRGDPSEFEGELDGRVYHFHFVPVRDDDGEVFAALGMSQDVTERKEYERELEQYEAIVEAVDDGVYVLDDEFRFVDVNDAYCEMTGYDREELLGEHCSLVVGQAVTDESAEQLEEIIAGEMAGSVIEADIHRADGTRLRAESRFTAIDVEGDGEPLKVGVVRDVSERVERERALEESEQRYRTLVESYPDGAVAMFDSDLRYTVAGGQLLEAEGVDPEERIGERIFDLYPEELIEEVEPHFRAALEGEVNSFEVRYRGLDLFNYTLPVESADGEVLGGMLVVNDVTEQREYERQLEQYERIVETVDDGVYVLDGDGDFRLVNQALVDMTEFDREELVGAHASAVFGERFDELDEDISQALRSGERDLADFEEEIYTASGETITVENRFVLFEIGEELGRVGVVRDISERKAHERRLERFRSIIETVEDGVYTIDSEGYITMVNSAYAEMVGRHREELIGMHATELVDEDVAERAREIEAKLAESGSATARLTAELKTADDRTVIAEATFALLPGEDEKYERVAVVRDITERVEREAELERALDLLDKAEDIAEVGGWEIAVDTMDVYWSDQVFHLLDIPPGEEPPMEEARDIYHPEDRHIVEDAIEEALETGEPFDVEARFFKQDDAEPHWARIWGVPELEDGEIRRIRGAFQDVTERVRREQELRERVEQEDAVTQLGTLALEEPDLDRLFERATAAVAETLDNDLCKLLELDPDDDTLALRAGRGWDDGLVGSTTLGIGDDSIAGRTLATEEAIVVDDIASEDPADRPDLLTSHGGRSGVSVVVGTPSDPWGVLGTYDTDVKSFSRHDVNFVQSVANILGIAIERASREEELHRRIEQQQVVTDLGRRALEDVDLDGLFEEAVERVAETLDNEYAKVLELQPGGESLLLRSGVGWRDGLVGEGTVGTGDDSQAGHTLRSEEPIVVADLTSESRFTGPELLRSHDVHSGISTVIGPHDDPWGVLGTHDTDPREFSQQDVNFVQSVANILATAIDRRTREREIEEQRNRMAAIVRLSEIVQEVDQAVIRQSSREEIDRMVCTHLVDSGEYEAAWVGDVNLASERISPRAVAGVDDGLVEPESFDADGEEAQSPTAVAAATGESEFARDGPDSAAFPDFARKRGYRSMAAVPLAYEDVRYGVLTLFSAREDAFVGYERTILEQLGGTIGHAINAIDRKQALVGDSFTELEIRFPDVIDSLDVQSDPDGEGHTITVDGTVPSDGGRMIQYVSVRGLDPETFRQAASGLPAVETIRQIGGDEGPTHRYEVTYADPPITSTLAAYGGRIESIGFDVPDLRVTVALPSTADVRQIVQALRAELPEVRIDAQRTVTREPTSTEEYRDDIQEALTERQRTALMTAFFAGYFEWSRESTGEEVAETLGVSPSTFHQHLRAAQRKVLARLFEDDR